MAKEKIWREVANKRLPIDALGKHFNAIYDWIASSLKRSVRDVGAGCTMNGATGLFVNIIHRDFIDPV